MMLTAYRTENLERSFENVLQDFSAMLYIKLNHFPIFKKAALKEKKKRRLNNNHITNVLQIKLFSDFLENNIFWPMKYNIYSIYH